MADTEFITRESIAVETMAEESVKSGYVVFCLSNHGESNVLYASDVNDLTDIYNEASVYFGTAFVTAVHIYDECPENPDVKVPQKIFGVTDPELRKRIQGLPALIN